MSPVVKLEWKRSKRATWAREMDLWSGKIQVAHVFKNIGSKGAKDTYRLVFLLPQIKTEDTLLSLPEESLEEAKTHAENVVGKWFEAATGDAP
jgi:hypothetical protein